MSTVSTEVVPYSQLERMALAVAKSKLYGIQTQEQALVLMALCQAEGIPAMTAVRDYHIINNRPSLKSETMLARFLSSGGKVQWHELTDAKAEATFSHPSGGSIRLDWTIDRAKQAGLAGKEIWKSYPRAMLRNRLISEGVRTVNPSIVQGLYTAEEIQNMTPELQEINVNAAVDSFDSPVLPESTVLEWLGMLSSAKDMHDLKLSYQGAHQEAIKARDAQRIGTFALAYEARKGELQEQPKVEATT